VVGTAPDTGIGVSAHPTFQSAVTASSGHEPPTQDIKSRAARKQQLLDEADSSRRLANSTKRVETELFNIVRRDKVDSIQKMQVRQGPTPASCLVGWVAFCR
jgi:hypothetical protein